MSSEEETYNYKFIFKAKHIVDDAYRLMVVKYNYRYDFNDKFWELLDEISDCGEASRITYIDSDGDTIELNRDWCTENPELAFELHYDDMQEKCKIIVQYS